MNAVLRALALAGLLASAAAAQVPPLPVPQQPMTTIGLRTYVGAFAPVLPLVATPPNLDYASVALASGVAVGLELDYRLGSELRAYAGLTHARSRVNHSDLLILQGPYRSDSPVELFVPTLGLLWSPLRLGPTARVTLRAGGGIKFYDFNLVEVPNGVQDPTADVGLGITAGGSPVAFMAEARWLLSQFDPAYLPVSVSGSKQWQNDLVLELGFRFGL